MPSNITALNTQIFWNDINLNDPLVSANDISRLQKALQAKDRPVITWHNWTIGILPLHKRSLVIAEVILLLAQSNDLDLLEAVDSQLQNISLREMLVQQVKSGELQQHKKPLFNAAEKLLPAVFDGFLPEDASSSGLGLLINDLRQSG